MSYEKHMLPVFHLSCELVGQRWSQIGHGREWRPTCFLHVLLHCECSRPYCSRRPLSREQNHMLGQHSGSIIVGLRSAGASAYSRQPAHQLLHPHVQLRCQSDDDTQAWVHRGCRSRTRPSRTFGRCRWRCRRRGPALLG